MRRSLVISLFTLALATPLTAQTTWGLRTAIGAEKKITKGFDAGVEFKYHQADDFKSTDRWSIGVSLSKRLYRNQAKTFNVKAGLGYKYLNVYNGWATKYKDDPTLGIEDGLDPQYYLSNNYDFNYSDTYVDHRHRVTASLQARPTIRFRSFRPRLPRRRRRRSTWPASTSRKRFRLSRLNFPKTWTFRRSPSRTSSFCLTGKRRRTITSARARFRTVRTSF